MIHASQRREFILQTLRQNSQPVTAGTLAAQLTVSRQIIVGDVALLRASGLPIIATPRGYCLDSTPRGLLRTLATVHNGDGIRAELYAMVDEGCSVLDVTVEHPVYGQMSAPLQLANRREVDDFVQRLQEQAAPPLSSLTGGIHLHTLCCPQETAFYRVQQSLRQLGMLME